MKSRREFIKLAAMSGGVAAAINLLPPVIARALAIPAANRTGTIRDVEHIVILMQENRSFDHYFGAMRGMRGFGDRFPIPLESGKPIWFQSNGVHEVPPFHFDKATMNAALIPGTPHNFPDQQGAWAQGKFGLWPMWKGDASMGYYTRAELPFQWALADAFTVCDHYFSSVCSGTDPNRIFFWSGSNFDPARRKAGLNSDMTTAEVVNLRAWISGTYPEPGYTYYGSALPWQSIPEVLEEAGIRWRIYQDPNDNWTGAMNGALAYAGIRNARPGTALYKNALSKWSLADLKAHVLEGSLPAVSWICPSRLQSEHPDAPSSPARGGDFTSQILEALTANPESWSKTVFFIMFDENDGLFDHLPRPAVPSYTNEGELAGKSTVDLAGMYFETDGTIYNDPLRARQANLPLDAPEVSYPLIDPRDTISGNIRPWGMGARVPMYVISPWSRGGWVSSQVFDHSSVGQFIEKRFGVHIPAISPWTRAVSGDLTSAFDFARPNNPELPVLPDMSGYAAMEKAARLLPTARPPAKPQSLYQEPGVRFSRALPYELHTHGKASPEAEAFTLEFVNSGRAGVVFHVYDKLYLELIPRRYTVEAGKALRDDWKVAATHGAYDLAIFGPNGYFRHFKGRVSAAAEPEVKVIYEAEAENIRLRIFNPSITAVKAIITDNAYAGGGPWPLTLKPGQSVDKTWPLSQNGRWYDFTLNAAEAPDYERRMAGRLENDRDGHSDPAMAIPV